MRANARNVRLYYPYWQYTDLFIFRFVSLLCLRSTLRLLQINTCFYCITEERTKPTSGQTTKAGGTTVSSEKSMTARKTTINGPLIGGVSGAGLVAMIGKTHAYTIPRVTRNRRKRGRFKLVSVICSNHTIVRTFLDSV